jgi:hypothetical protein
VALLRILGIWLIAGGALALISDVTRILIAKGGIVFLSLGGLWNAAHAQSLSSVQGALGRISLALADPLLASLLRPPAWMMLGVLGALLCWLGRRRKSVEVYSN